MHHCSYASHHQELGLSFKVVEGGVTVVGIWKKIYQESFSGYSNKSWGLELNKNLFENLPLRKDHPTVQCICIALDRQ